MKCFHADDKFVARCTWILFTAMICSWLNFSAVVADDNVSFSRDVLPVLSDRCFHCHGPDESNRQAGLRLDLEDSAKADLGGYFAVVDGKLQDSEIWNRIISDDLDELMPPPDSHRKPLSKSERQAIRKWIVSGAKWGKHWSFERLTRPAVPSSKSLPQQQHPIDAFVTDRLANEGLKLSPPAAAHTALRRLTFDLTGLSPTPEEVAEFGDGSEKQWQAAIDRLLKSPRYAERMSMWWLDAARYSDSDGFQQDATRQNWPWRDWVINQFRENRSFKDFTIEQFAGDLLPEATDEQKLATCFHRNHMTNGEGGRDPEESRIDYVIDRVNTTGAVWLGLTLGCVQCHSHKFDPISHHDYYSMAAFFNSIDENGKAGSGAKPYLKYESAFVQDRIRQTSNFVDLCRQQEKTAKQAAELRFETWLSEMKADPPATYSAWHTPAPKVSSSEGTQFVVDANQVIQAAGPKPRQDDYRITLPIPDSVSTITGWRLEVFPHEDHVDGRYSRSGNGEFTLTSVRMLVRPAGSPAETQLEIKSAIADAETQKSHKSSWDSRYGRINDTLNDDARDGWSTFGIEERSEHVGVFELDEPIDVTPEDRLVIVLRHRSTHGNANIGRFRVSLATEHGETVRRTDGISPVAQLIELVQKGEGDVTNVSSVSKELHERLLAQFLLSDDIYQQASNRLNSANRQLGELKSQQTARNVMVLAERSQARTTHVLERGVWDAKGDVVQPNVLPAVLKWPSGKATSRLDLANWIVDPENPLTARVVTNHVWQLLIGQGMVRTTEDFGLQGELPSHPKLLDWLAIELIESNWDLQHIIRLIVTSDTYRQSSTTSAALIERDPANRLLARAPRFRLPSWMIRDNALHVSGLLNGAIGGPPVRPYQPPGVWAEITMGRFRYDPSLGPEQYRRTVYAFWRRSSAPTFLFDSAQRRVCEVGVRRTNTPLHALTLMNDVTMLEASRALADASLAAALSSAASPSAASPSAASPESTAKDGAGSRSAALQFLATRVLSRQLSAAEMNTLHKVWTAAAGYYENHPDEAVSFCTVGQQAAPDAETVIATAAWMTVSSLLLNLDEAMTRE